MEPGRPTKYKSSYNTQAFKLSLLGATDQELADFFEVCEDTINEWKKVYSKFSVSIKKGKDKADAEVASKLYKRAIGYRYDEITFEKNGDKLTLEATFDGDIKSDESFKKKIVTKEVLPDTVAQIFWLKNRQSKKWKDKHEIESKNTNHTTIIDTTGATEDNPVHIEASGS